MNSERLGTKINAMEWIVVTIDQSRYPLLTSDRPLIMPHGLGKPYGHLLMPISPDRVFFAFWSEATRRRVIAQTYFAEWINDRVVRQARKIVWGTNDAQLRFIANRLGAKLNWSPLE